jgi:hypothetical protein
MQQRSSNSRTQQQKTTNLLFMPESRTSTQYGISFSIGEGTHIKLDASLNFGEVIAENVLGVTPVKLAEGWCGW